MKVDFIICGTQKGGTTALEQFLRDHPQICMSNKKEVHFFDDEGIFCDKIPSYSRYHSAFSPTPSHKLVGEATPIYMYWTDAPRRMWQYNKNLKIIVILRNPIERAYSHWNMERHRNNETLSFWEAIQSESHRCREALPFQHRVYSYIDRGFYLEQLRRLSRYFLKEQILILRNEDLKNSQLETLQKICRFLCVDLFHNYKVKEVFAHPYLSPLGDREKEYLRSVFEYEIRGLERVLGWDCSNWLSD